jgi:hypothetical protein
VSSTHPHAINIPRMCSGAGAVVTTGGLFLEIGTTTSRACRCKGGPPARAAVP